MKFSITVISLFLSLNLFAQVGIGTVTPSPKSMLDVSSTSDGGTTYRGLMPPRVPSNVERNSINPNNSDTGLLVFVESTGCLQMWSGASWVNIQCATVTPEPWINEIHYNNNGADANEGIEIAGESGINLNNYIVVFYRGDGTQQGATLNLSGIITNEGSGYGAESFPRIGLLNGTGGIALYNITNNNLVQSISYEGTVIAVEDVAAGRTSIDIGQFETNATLVSESLQLTGTGTFYSDFIWQSPAAASMGTINVGQTIN